MCILCLFITPLSHTLVKYYVNVHELNGRKMGETEKTWERPWSSDEIRKNSAKWTLAGDIGLLNHLQDFSQYLISRTHEMEKIVDGLVHQTKESCAKVDNVINDFQMLSNLKFVENRVYDEEIVDSPTETKENTQSKSKEEQEAEMLSRVKQALQLGLNVLDQAFEKVEVDESSDSEDEDLPQSRTELTPKDLYEHRPLPFIIGSEAFQNDDFAGLKYMLDDESILEESSAQDDDMISRSEDESETETDEDLDFDNNEPQQNQYEPPKMKEELPKIVPTVEANRTKKLSESEGSDLFGDDDDDASVSSLDAPITEEPVLRKPSVREEPKIKNTFLDELGSKLKIPPKAETPEKPPKPIPSSEKSVPRKSTVSNKEKEHDNDDLFTNDNDDSLFNDDESPFGKSDGLFTNTKFTKPTHKKDTISDQLFGKSEKSLPVKKDSIVEVKKTEKRDSLFDEDDDQDLFGSFSSKTSSTEPETRKISTSSTKVNASPSFESMTKTSSPSSSTKGSIKSLSVKGKSKDSLFGSDSDDDLFSGTKATQSKKSIDFTATNDDAELFGSLDSKSNKVSKPEPKTNVPDPKVKKTPSLFDDGDDFDLFGSLSKSKSQIKEATKVPIASTFLEKSDTSLFEESTDLFSPAPVVPKEVKPKEKKTEKTDLTKVLPSPKANVVASNQKNASSDDADQLTKENPMVPVTDILETTNADEIGFDKPVDNANTLSALNKDRAKIQIKRRKPTRKGRQALQNLNNDQDDKVEVDQESHNTPSSESKKSNSDDLFASVKSPPKKILISPKPTSSTEHKAKEREKKDLMSQIMAEAATSRIGKRNSILDIPDDDDDLFSNSSKTNDKSKLGSDFSFMSPTSLKPNDLFSSDLLNKNEADANIFGSSDELFSQEPTTFHNDILTNKSPFSPSEDDDDDIFKTTTKDVTSQSSDDIFGGDSGDDIFADMGDDKYGMFPKSKLDDDDEDDIFSNLKQTTKPVMVKESKPAAKQETKKKTQDIFEDPLGGLSLND